MRGVFIFCALVAHFWAYSQFDPAGGLEGSKGILPNSKFIQRWADSCLVKRGYKDIAKKDSGFASIGTSKNAVGEADAKIVSLGDGGQAILFFQEPIFDGPGYDFAVFENGFQIGLSYFLELGFVEVSEDGENYVRFPAKSLTDTTVQKSNADFLKPENLHNLAGKHQYPYGTPFDLEEVGLYKIQYVKIIDVVGAVSGEYVSRDADGTPINDPYPTPFESGGFDLDAVAVLNTETVDIQRLNSQNINVYPTLTNKNSTINIIADEKFHWQVSDELGQFIKAGNDSYFSLTEAGMYFITIYTNYEKTVKKLCVY